MLKFSGIWDYGRVHHKRVWKNYNGMNDPFLIPTVDEVDEFNAGAYADTILQILNGQAIHWREEHADNEIREIKDTAPWIPPKVRKKVQRLPKQKVFKTSYKYRKLFRILMASGRYTEDEADQAILNLLGVTLMSETNGAKPLHALSEGIVLLVGVKASNFDEEIKTHPRVIMWDSQNQNWERKELPSNTRAVFMTRWIGHSAFNRIVKEARKRHITVFNPEGTGLIAKQVRQLLNINHEPEPEPVTIQPETTPMPKPHTHGDRGKLAPLYPFIDLNKGNAENGRVLYAKAQEMGIQTTLGSVIQMVSVKRRKTSGHPPKTRTSPAKPDGKLDVTIEIFDNLVKELKDMRQFLIDTVAENARLRMKVDKFKKFFED